MSTRTKPSKIDLNALLKGLNAAHIEFVLVGGLAAVIQGAPVTTFDLDIVHRQTDKNIKKLTKFLKSVRAIQRRPDKKILEPNEKDLRGTGHLLLATCFGPLDILGSIEKGLGFDELLPSAIEIEFQGYPTYILNLETMVALKRGSKIPKEQYQLQIYEETLRLKRQTENTD